MKSQSEGGIHEKKRQVSRREFMHSRQFDGKPALAAVWWHAPAAPDAPAAAATAAPAAEAAAPAAASRAASAYSEAPMLAELVAAGRSRPWTNVCPPTRWSWRWPNPSASTAAPSAAASGASPTAGADQACGPPLVWFDKDLIQRPRLVESWELSDDATEWTFHLRPGHQLVGRCAADDRRCAWWWENEREQHRPSPGSPAR